MEIRVEPWRAREVTLTFPASDGWALVAALRDYAVAHPNAVERDAWLQWARDLDRALRS